MDSRIRLKIGEIELEYEGSEDFIKSELLGMVTEVATLYRESHLGTPQAPPAPAAEEVFAPASGVSLTTGTIASRVSSKTGSDLVIAAAAHLTFVQRVSPFTRRQLLDEMKTAGSYYKKTYSNNLTSYLESLVKAGALVESAKDTYALSAGKHKELESIVAA